MSRRFHTLEKKVPGTRPGEVQQGGEDGEREASSPSSFHLGLGYESFKKNTTQ